MDVKMLREITAAAQEADQGLVESQLKLVEDACSDAASEGRYEAVILNGLVPRTIETLRERGLAVEQAVSWRYDVWIISWK